MAESVRKQPTKTNRTNPEEAPEVTAQEKDATREAELAEIDDLLDEIDEVLEVNAEAFVRGYVQRGGQ